MVRSRSQRTRTRAESGAPSPSRSVARNEPPSKRGRVSIRLRIGTSFARRSSSWPPPAWATTSSRPASVFSVKSSANGVSGSSTNAWLAWTKNHEAGGKPAFPILDLYAGVWQGEPVASDDYVLSCQLLLQRPSVFTYRNANGSRTPSGSTPQLPMHSVAGSGPRPSLNAFSVARAPASSPTSP